MVLDRRQNLFRVDNFSIKQKPYAGLRRAYKNIKKLFLPAKAGGSGRTSGARAGHCRRSTARKIRR